MRGLVFSAVVFGAACGSSSGGPGADGGSPDGASAGLNDAGGGVDAGEPGMDAGMMGTDGGGVSGPGIGDGDCIPIASSKSNCQNASKSYAYICSHGANPAPEANCTGGNPIACCEHPLCIRDANSDYQCTPTNASLPPHAYLCYDDAPTPPAGCQPSTLSGSSTSSTRICCP